jgi:branched-chain amino acid aminotransferase
MSDAAEEVEKIWMDGKYVDWDDATMHVCAHVIHYGNAVFDVCCFNVMNGKMYTIPLGARILPGITRDTVITHAEELGIELVEQFIPCEMLCIADGLFFTGTAAEISPIRSVDTIAVGEGKRGPVATKLQELFFKYVNAEIKDKHNWLTFIE